MMGTLGQIARNLAATAYRGTIYPWARRDNAGAVRRNVNRFLKRCMEQLPLEGPALDIGPQPNSLSTRLFSSRFEYATLDIDTASGADIVADICHMPQVLGDSFGVIVCTEVLEHTRNPFAAVEELARVLRPGGHLLCTTPFNLRIHGPAPDCWRFTEDGLRVLFAAHFAILEIRSLKPLIRREMPIHYTAVLRKPLSRGA
ncbi:MAG: class I SAM-dependent methyltransferase [Candidatus Sumerlaeota bacterium]|nr:class I SAM-dependent methyltransferase [Candidatus Sumerlaeota bacterium]